MHRIVGILYVGFAGGSYATAAIYMRHLMRVKAKVKENSKNEFPFRIIERFWSALSNEEEPAACRPRFDTTRGDGLNEISEITKSRKYRWCGSSIESKWNLPHNLPAMARGILGAL